jgi:hypothetical protein
MVFVFYGKRGHSGDWNFLKSESTCQAVVACNEQAANDVGE